MICIESLRAERDAVDSGIAIAAEPAVLDGARIGFERHLDVRRELHERASGCEKTPDFVRCEQAWRAAAEKYRDQLASLRSRCVDRKILDQGIDILLLRNHFR